MNSEDRVNILLVDDRPENLLALVVALEGLGENLVTAGSGAEALRRVLEDDFAVILMDVAMPEMDGFETAALIRERDRYRLTPVIFVTAISTADTHVFKGYSLGAVDYILKPIVPEILRSKVAVFADLFRKTRQVQRLVETLKRRTLEMETVNLGLESFSYAVSHDLRRPLRAIRGFAQILVRRHRDSLDPEGQHYLDNIVEASARMERQIEDLLTYSRLGPLALRYQPLSLAEVLARVIENLSARMAESGANVEVPADLPEVVSCREVLEQILTNLVDNALTYCRPGVPPRVAVACEEDRESFTLRVRDHGLGIAPEDRERIFQVFQRAHGDLYPGSGLGLALVKRGVDLMGGRAWVEPAEGEGSMFCVKLPRARVGVRSGSGTEEAALSEAALLLGAEVMDGE